VRYSKLPIAFLKSILLPRFLFSWVLVRLSPLGTLATNVIVVRAPNEDNDDDDDDEFGAVGRMGIGKGNRNTCRKPPPVPFYAPKIPHDLTWHRILPAAMEIRRLTA
jgi:hypothetical protein